MNAGRYVGASVPVRGPLAGLVEGFDEWLFGRGYSVRTVDTQMRMVRDLSLWVDRRGLAVSALDGALIESYAADRRSRTRALRSARGLGEKPPQAALSTVAGPGAQSLQEQLVLNQPAGGQIDQPGGRVLRRPAPSPQPTQEGHMGGSGPEHALERRTHRSGIVLHFP